MKNDNLYIEALKFGRDNMNSGVSFSEMKTHLESKGHVISENFKGYLRFWFYENFFKNGVTNTLNYYSGSTSAVLSYLNEGKFDYDKCIMTGNAYENLIDFENLQQARKSSKQSYMGSIWAIVISAVFAAIQIVLAIVK
jgi:hypothetical protein